MCAWAGRERPSGGVNRWSMSSAHPPALTDDDRSGTVHPLRAGWIVIRPRPGGSAADLQGDDVSWRSCSSAAARRQIPSVRDEGREDVEVVVCRSPCRRNETLSLESPGLRNSNIRPRGTEPMRPSTGKASWRIWDRDNRQEGQRGNDRVDAGPIGGGRRIVGSSLVRRPSGV